MCCKTHRQTGCGGEVVVVVVKVVVGVVVVVVVAVVLLVLEVVRRWRWGDGGLWRTWW